MKEIDFTLESTPKTILAATKRTHRHNHHDKRSHFLDLHHKPPKPGHRNLSNSSFLSSPTSVASPPVNGVMLGGLDVLFSELMNLDSLAGLTSVVAPTYRVTCTCTCNVYCNMHVVHSTLPYLDDITIVCVRAYVFNHFSYGSESVHVEMASSFSLSFPLPASFREQLSCYMDQMDSPEFVGWVADSIEKEQNKQQYLQGVIAHLETEVTSLARETVDQMEKSMSNVRGRERGGW